MTTKYTAIELLKIIKTAKKLGVSEFQLGELKLKFGEMPVAVVRANAERAAEAFSENESDVKQDQLENLRLTDPMAYEQLVCNDLDKEDTRFGAQ